MAFDQGIGPFSKAIFGFTLG